MLLNCLLAQELHTVEEMIVYWNKTFKGLFNYKTAWYFKENDTDNTKNNLLWVAGWV